MSTNARSTLKSARERGEKDLSRLDSRRELNHIQFKNKETSKHSVHEPCTRNIGQELEECVRKTNRNKRARAYTPSPENLTNVTMDNESSDTDISESEDNSVALIAQLHKVKKGRVLGNIRNVLSYIDTPQIGNEGFSIRP